MKQTIEEDKEPEKSGWTLLFDINERFLGSPSGIMFIFIYQNCQKQNVFMPRVMWEAKYYLRAIKKGQDLGIKDCL